MFKGYLFTALILTLIIPSIGIVMGMVRAVINRVLSLISPQLSFFICNYITFPGVILHELSHAAFGFITGAKIKKVTLFRPNGSTLGSVEMIYRGPWLVRCIQTCFSSCAPVVGGMVACLILYSFIIPNITVFYIGVIVYYLFFSIIMHMTMSMMDIKCFGKGVVGVYLIISIICVVTKFDLFIILN